MFLVTNQLNNKKVAGVFSELKLDFTFLSHLFPLPCGAGSTVPREGFDSSVIMPFSWCIVAVTLPILCRSTSSVKPLYIHFRCVAGIHGGCG